MVAPADVLACRMAQPWKTLERVATSEGSLELRQRGPRDFLITVGGRVLMTSQAHRSEDVLAKLACEAIRPQKGVKPKVLIGGLGMGFTVRAALDALPRAATVKVAELNRQVVAWCRGPLGALTDQAVADRRVTVEVIDVAEAISVGRDHHAIILDLYEGPHQATQQRDDPLYGPAALSRTARALGPGGIFAVWSEEADAPFEARLRAAGFTVEKHKVGGGRTHIVYLATLATPAVTNAASSSRKR